MKFTLFEKLKDLPFITIVTLSVAAVMVAVLVVALVRAGRRKEGMQKQQSATRMLVYGSLCVALSFLLSYLKFFEMPQGGSITLCSLLPVALYAHLFGTRNGLIAGFAFGLLQFFQKPIAMHWLSPFLDYVLAFTCVGLAGLFPKNLPLGIVVGGIGRILCSTISGAVFFAEYAPEGMNPWVYSTIYNTISLGPDAVLCIVVAVLPPVKRAIEQIAPRQEKKAQLVV